MSDIFLVDYGENCWVSVNDIIKSTAYGNKITSVHVPLHNLFLTEIELNI